MITLMTLLLTWFALSLPFALLVGKCIKAGAIVPVEASYRDPRKRLAVVRRAPILR